MCVIKIDADPQPLEHNSRQMLLPSGSWFLHRTVKKIQGNLSWVFGDEPWEGFSSVL